MRKNIILFHITFETQEQACIRQHALRLHVIMKAPAHYFLPKNVFKLFVRSEVSLHCAKAVQMANGLHLYRAFLLIEHSKHFTDECLRHLPIHTQMAEATISVVNLRIGSSWGFSVLLKEPSTRGVGIELTISQVHLSLSLRL